MVFKVGDKVTIAAKEKYFYKKVYGLITYNGTVTRSGLCITDVLFSNKSYSVSIITKNLTLSKNQQLLFSFMKEHNDR